MTDSPNRDLHVEVDANVIRQLGEELITDAEQALLELIKNAYDADAKVARVVVNTFEPCDSTGKGWITVEDDGLGMDLHAIEHGWLTISFSLKRSPKNLGVKTPLFHRTPLGDKGLGRLGTMKIGDSVEITTHSKKGAHGHSVRLSWADFAPGTVLSRIPVDVEIVEPAPRTGTKLKICGLREPHYWRGTARHQHLIERLSTLISPFHRFANFRIAIEVDGSDLDLHEVGTDVRNAATSRFTFTWSGAALKCQAEVKLGLFRGSTDEGEFETLVAADHGKSLGLFLKSEAKLKGSLTIPSTGPWFVRVTEEIGAPDVLAAGAESPGPFRGELDSFELDGTEGEELFSSGSEYRRYIKRFAGVSVYRDHFAVRMEEDWLRLGQSWTSGRSYYGLKPANTIGFFELTASQNANLWEKSDREGFLDTGAARSFFAITRECVGFANSTLTGLRRAFLAFKSQRNATGRLDTSWTPPDAIRALNEAKRSGQKAQAHLATLERQRKTSIVRVRDSLEKLLAREQLPSAQQKAAAEAVRQLDILVSEWEQQRAVLDEQLGALKEDHALTSALLQRFEQFKTQLSDVYETVGLGLVAEGLAHEMDSILEDLVQRSNRIAPRARRSGDQAIVGYLEAVRTTVSALRKQVSFLDPMLRTTREQRSVFSVAAFVEELLGLQRDRLARFNIEPMLEIEKDFTVTMSKGRLRQVLDNLIRNSEFWLRRHPPQTPGRQHWIRVRITAPEVSVSDSGSGVKPSVENILFEPFISGKPGGQGRGLGLFISRQLLARDGCEIFLDPERNAKGRRFKFVVSLSAVEKAG